MQSMYTEASFVCLRFAWHSLNPHRARRCLLHGSLYTRHCQPLFAKTASSTLSQDSLVLFSPYFAQLIYILYVRFVLINGRKIVSGGEKKVCASTIDIRLTKYGIFVFYPVRILLLSRFSCFSQKEETLRFFKYYLHKDYQAEQ